MGEEDLVLAPETEEPFLERLRAELTPVSLPSELRLSEKTGSELTRCMAAVGGPTSAMAGLSPLDLQSSR